MYELGDRVMVTGRAVRQVNDKEESKRWVAEKFDSPIEGIITGRRTIMDGRMVNKRWRRDAGTSRVAWIVAIRLNGTPIRCFENQLKGSRK
jgi:hypothetical protein